MKTRTPANAIRIILLVCEEFFPFEFSELDPSESEGPSATFPRFLSVGGGGTPENGRVGAGFVGDIDGDNDGAVEVELIVVELIVVALNGFPSFLQHQFIRT